ncbi:MAG: hypothetical protein R3C20_01605 [Planctomycetaceae bacterium]
MTTFPSPADSPQGVHRIVVLTFDSLPTVEWIHSPRLRRLELQSLFFERHYSQIQSADHLGQLLHEWQIQIPLKFVMFRPDEIIENSTWLESNEICGQSVLWIHILNAPSPDETNEQFCRRTMETMEAALAGLEFTSRYLMVSAIQTLVAADNSGMAVDSQQWPKVPLWCRLPNHRMQRVQRLSGSNDLNPTLRAMASGSLKPATNDLQAQSSPDREVTDSSRWSTHPQELLKLSESQGDEDNRAICIETGARRLVCTADFVFAQNRPAESSDDLQQEWHDHQLFVLPEDFWHQNDQSRVYESVIEDLSRQLNDQQP